MSKSPIMTGPEQHAYRASMRQRADKSRSLTRREARRLKRKEGLVTFSLPKIRFVPIVFVKAETDRWNY